MEPAPKPRAPTTGGDLVLCTTNPGKAREICAILPAALRPAQPAEMGFVLPDVPEDGDTFAANAAIKAAAGAAVCGQPCLADDSGLCVDALGGAPGIRSARFAADHGRAAPGAPGPARTAANNALLLERLDGVPTAERTAGFECAVAVALPRAHPLVGAAVAAGAVVVDDAPRLPSGWAVVVTTGRVDGRILEAPRGDGGFGYDPLFFADELGATFAEAAPAAKAGVSHRGRALAALASLFRAAGIA